MRADNAAALAAATQARANLTRARARDAIRRLDRDGTSITFAAVATHAGVSRSLLYRDHDLRPEIDRLRAATPTSTRPPPAAERSSDTSLQQRLAAALDDNRDLRREIQTLRDQLAVVLGEQRVTAAPRSSSTIIGTCS